MMRRCTAIFLLNCPLLYAECQLSYAQGSAAFPIIDPVTQTARDIDRRHILESELHAEHQGLLRAQAALAAGITQERTADVHRRLENIKSLQRELDGVSGKRQPPREPLRVVVKAQRPPGPTHRNMNGPAAFWNPYNRAPDFE